MNRPLLISILLLLLIAPAFALEVPAATGFVNDYASVLSPAEQAQLEATLTQINQNSTVEIAILTIPTLDGEDLALYATQVFRAWGVGKKDVNNGVLILVVRDDRKVRIEVGYGMEGAVTDTAAGLIIRRKLSPAFREGRFYDGLAAGVNDIAALAAEDPAVRSEYTSDVHAALRPYEIWTIIVLTAVYLVLVIYAAIKFNNTQKKLKWKSGWFSLIVMLAFFFGSAVGWLTLFLCFLILIFSSGSAFIFLPGGGGLGGSG